MNFLFNEQSAIENMIKMRVVDSDNIFVTIKDLARYNYFINNMDKDDIHIKRGQIWLKFINRLIN